MEVFGRKIAPGDLIHADKHGFIVVTPLGVKLCRPSETVLDLLPDPLAKPFVKENGQVILDA